MTVEKASEIVSALREAPNTGHKEYDLFEHFIDFFGFKKPEKQEMFARMCGYGIARFVEIDGEEEG